MCPSDSENQMAAEAAAIPTTDTHLALAKEIEKFSVEVKADLAETFYAFRNFALGKQAYDAKVGDTVTLDAGADVTGDAGLVPEAEEAKPDNSAID